MKFEYIDSKKMSYIIILLVGNLPNLQDIIVCSWGYH